MRNFRKYKNFVHLTEPVVFDGFKCIGYFPYTTAAIYGKVVRMPRSVMQHLLPDLPSDNKIVYIFEDTTSFGTQDFALFFYDLMVVCGTWDAVVGYGGGELELL